MSDPIKDVKAAFDWSLIVKIFVVFVIINAFVDLVVTYGGAAGSTFATFVIRPFSVIKGKLTGTA